MSCLEKEEVHWLHIGREGYDEEELKRLNDVRIYLFGNGDEEVLTSDDENDDETVVDEERKRKDIVGSAIRGEVRKVSRCCSLVKSYFELKYRISIKERASWVRIIKEAALKSHALPHVCEKLYETARKILDVRRHQVHILKEEYKGNACAIAAQLESACCDDTIQGFISIDRNTSRRRALCTFADTERRFTTLESIIKLHDEHLLPKIIQGGSRSHEANLALGILRLCSSAELVSSERCQQWQTLWAQWNAENCASEAEAVWLTLLCRARKKNNYIQNEQQVLNFSNNKFTQRLFNEALRRLGIPVGGSRAIESTWRGWPSRYKFLATVSGDIPNDRCLRKLAKLIIATIIFNRQQHLHKFSKLLCSLKSYVHPSNIGNWTPKIGLLLSEFCRELARIKAKLSFIKNDIHDATIHQAASLIAPLLRDALYSRHYNMIATSIISLRDLCGISPRLVAEASVPTLLSSLESHNARLYGHQAPAALRACATLTRPLLLRSQNWSNSSESDAFLNDPLSARRVAYFHGTLPSENMLSPNKTLRNDPVIVRLGATAQLMTLAVDLIDVNNNTKTRCALLFFDAMLRWIPVLDDDDHNTEELFDTKISPVTLGLELGENWAPRFLDRLLNCIEHRDATARIPNSGEHGDALLGENSSARYANFLASARDAASAELFRIVVQRLFLRLKPNARRRLCTTLSNWIQSASSRPATAKDTASLVSAACQHVHKDVIEFPPGVSYLLQNVLIESILDSDSPSRLAFLTRLLAGGVRSLHPELVVKLLPQLELIFERCLDHSDKLVRKCARKLLRDTLRGLVETRPYLNSSSKNNQDMNEWPKEEVDKLSDIVWLIPQKFHHHAKNLLNRHVEQPLRVAISSNSGDKNKKEKFLISVRQLHQGVKGACAALNDQDDDQRARLLQLTLNAWEIWTVQYATDAKSARALLKASRSLLLLRHSAHCFKARSALGAVRSRRRAMGLDAVSRETAILNGTIEPRGTDDYLERAICFHWTRCLDNAHQDVRVLRQKPQLSHQYATLLDHCLTLLSHDYGDIRGAASELLDAAWPFYGWLLKPKIGQAIHNLKFTVQASKIQQLTKSSISGALALLASRSSYQKLTADATLGTALCQVALDWDIALDALPKDERDELAAKLAGLLALYVSRHCKPVHNPVAITERAIAKARQPGLHWRHAFLSAFVAMHSLSAASYLQQDKDPRVCAMWRDFVLPYSVMSNDEPLPRLALSSLFRRACDYRTQKDDLVGSFFFGEDDANLYGMLLALRREHRRERARDSDEVISSSPLIDTLLREARHSESWAVFPKSMAPYSSRGFRSRHARFLKRLIRQSPEHTLIESALRVSRLALETTASAPASEVGAATATAAEAWAGALRAVLRADKNIPTQSFFDILEKALRTASPEHALCWADALRYATGGHAAGYLLNSGLLVLLEAEWLRQLDLSQDEASWSAVAKWLALFPSLVYELSAFLKRNQVKDQEQFLVPLGRIAIALLANADHAFHAVRERIGQCLAALAGGALELGLVINLHQLHDLTQRSSVPGKLDEALEKDELSRLRRFRETALAWAKHAARDGGLREVACLIPPALNAVADNDDDTRTAAALAVAAMMHTSRVDAYGVEPILESLLQQTAHPKWRARCAVAAYLGALVSRHALYLSSTQIDLAFGALRTLCADKSAEVRDASRASLASLISTAVPSLELEHLVLTCYDQAHKYLPLGSNGSLGSMTEDTARIRLGAVQALGATVIAFPYDVPPHVPRALVLLSKHHDLARVSSSSKLDTESRRHHVAIRAAVKHTIAEFKRTHADTWPLIKDFFSFEESEALADVLTAGDYLV